MSVPPPRADTVVGLAAGEYYVLAVDDITQDASRDPDVLEQMVRAATRVTLAEVVAAQATQDVYVLGQLKDQNAHLQAEQQSLRYQSASLHGPAQTAQEATATGMQRTTGYTTVTTQPVALDLQKPIGPAQPDDSPVWQRAFAAVFGSRDAAAAQP